MRTMPKWRTWHAKCHINLDALNDRNVKRASQGEHFFTEKLEWEFFRPSICTILKPLIQTRGQSISSLGKVPIEILLGKSQITSFMAVLLFAAEFQMEPLAN